MKLKGRVVVDRAWLKAMRLAPRVVEQEMRRGLRQAARAVRDRARSLASRKKGRLRKSIRHRVSRLRAIVFTSLWYGRVRNEGTGYLPGGVLKARERSFRFVRGKNGKFLRDKRGRKIRKKLGKMRDWMQFRIGDRWVRVKQVRQKGTHFLERGLDAGRGDIEIAFKDTGRRIAKRVFGG